MQKDVRRDWPGRRACTRAIYLGLAPILLSGCGGETGVPSNPVQPGEPPASLAGGITNGENYLVQDLGGTIFLGFGGTLWGYPDWDTFLACNGGYSTRFRTVSTAGSTQRRALPSITAAAGDYRSEWMRGLRPVMASGNSTVWVVVGCVKAGIPDGATFEAIFGSAGWGRIVTVSQALLDQLPTGPNASAPVRPSGTLVKSTGGAAVRWVTYHGGALGVPSGQVLSSHCRTFGEIVEVSPAVFASYAETGLMEMSTASCPVTNLDHALQERLFGSVVVAGPSHGYLATPSQTPDNRHAGIDYPGTRTVLSPVRGIVRAASTTCGSVVLEDTRPLSTWPGAIARPRHVFLHMRNITVLGQVGAIVEVGTPLGTSSDAVGGGCLATGPHLHYEIRKDYTGTSGVGASSCQGCSTASLTYDPYTFPYP